METIKGALLIVTLAGQMPVVRQTAAEGTPRAGRASTATLSSVCFKVLGRNDSLGLAIDPKAGNSNGLWTPRRDERANRQSERDLASNADRNRSGAKGSKRGATGIAA